MEEKVVKGSDATLASGGYFEKVACAEDIHRASEQQQYTKQTGGMNEQISPQLHAEEMMANQGMKTMDAAMASSYESLTVLEEVEIELQESDHFSFEDMIRNNCVENVCLQEGITQDANSKGVETKCKSIEKADYEDVLVTEIDHSIPGEVGFTLGQVSHPSSEDTLQNKLDSSEPIREKMQIRQEDDYQNAKESYVENSDDQGEPTSNPDTVIDTVTKECSHPDDYLEDIFIQGNTDEQQGVTEEAAVRDYGNEVSDATDEQAGFINQGQSEPREEGEPTEFKSLDGDLSQEAAPTGVTFVSIEPEVDKLPNLSATQQENKSESNVYEESMDSEAGNTTLNSQYDNTEGREKQMALHDTGTLVTKEQNVTPRGDGEQAKNSTEEENECLGAETTMHDTVQEDASFDMNFDLSRVRDETSDIGDTGNSAEEMYPKNENTNDEASIKSGNVISEYDKEESKMQMQDIQQESLAEDLVSQSNTAEEKKMQIDTSEEFIESDKVKCTLPDSLTEKVAEVQQDNEEKAQILYQEANDTEREDLSVSSSIVIHKTKGQGEYFDLSREENEVPDSGDKENTTTEPPKLEHVMEKTSTMSGDNNEEITVQLKDVPQAPVAKYMNSQNINTEEKFVREDTTEDFTEGDQVKGISQESHQDNMTMGNTDYGEEAYKLPKKNLFTLSNDFEREYKDLSNSSLIVKDETSADSDNDHVSRLEGKISEKGDNKSLTAIEEVTTLSEIIISQDEKKEEEKIQMEDVPQESMATKIIFQSENVEENVMQMKETIEESETSPASPAKEIAERYLHDREAKQPPENIVEQLSIVSKEVEIEHPGLSIHPTIDKNETTAEGENEKLEVEEHPAAENTAGETSSVAESTTFQDDNTELKITELVDVSPEPMKENILSHYYTEENLLQAEGTSRESTKYENVEGSSPKPPVADAEDHIKDGEETKEFHEENYESHCIERNEDEKEHKDLIQDSSTCETSPGGQDENLKVLDHPKVKNPIEALLMAGNRVSEGEKNEEEKVQSEDSSKTPTEDDHVTGTCTQTSIEKKIESNADDVKVREEFLEEMSMNGDDENLTAETSPDNGKIIEEASLVAENIIIEDNETKEMEMRMEGPEEQSSDEGNLVNTPPESPTKEKAETVFADDGHEAIESSSEQCKEEDYLVDASSDSLANEEAETCTDDGRQGKEFTKEATRPAGESFSIEHAEVERKPKDLDHGLPVLDHATLTIEDNEEVMVEQNEQIKEVTLSAGNTFHQDDITDVVEIQKEDSPQRSMNETATPEDDKTGEQNARIEFINEELTKDEVATSTSPGYPIQEVIQTDTNYGKKETEYSEQKYENILMDSAEIEKVHEDAALDSSMPYIEDAKENVKKLTACENVKDEHVHDEECSAITTEVVQDDTASSNIEKFLPINLSPDDEGTDHKALSGETEHITDTGKEINELTNLDKSEKHNDQMQKEEAPEKSEEINEENKMETTHDELTTEYHTSTSTEPTDENIVYISADNGKKENELNEENADNHSVDYTYIGADQKDLGHQTSIPENVTCTREENKELKEEKSDKENIIEDTSTSARYPTILDDNTGENIETEYVTYETVERSTVSQDDDYEETYMQKDEIGQKIDENHTTVTSSEVPTDFSNKISTIDGNKANESITEECENLTFGRTEENNEMLKAQKDAKEEIIQLSSAIIVDHIPDNTVLNNTEHILPTDSEEGEGIEQTSEKDMEQDKMDEQIVLNDDNVTKGVGKQDLETPAKEYEESASRESTEGILIARSDNLEEPMISLKAEENSAHLEEKISEVLKEEKMEAGLPDDEVKYNDAGRSMARQEAFVRSRSIHDGQHAFVFSCQEEGSEKQQTEKATCEQSESFNEEVHQDSQTDEDKGIVESSNEEVNRLSKQVVDYIINNQQEHEVKMQETKPIEETEAVSISDQPRESAKDEVSEENYGKANENERFTEKIKELGSMHHVEASKENLLLEKTSVHVEASSSAAANVNCISADHEELFSLGQSVDTGIQVSGKSITDKAVDDVPDEVPDAQEKNDDDEVASSTTQLQDVSELSKKRSIEPIKEVDGGTTAVIETVNEALVARNKDDTGSQEVDKSKNTDTEMQMTSKGHGDAYMSLTEKLHKEIYQVNIPYAVATDSKFSESEEVRTTKNGKPPGESNTENNSSMLEDDDVDKLNHESIKIGLENEENQKDCTRVEESALQTETVTIISKKDASSITSIENIQEAEKSASAEKEEPNQEYEAYNSKNGSFPADENLKSDILVEKDEHEIVTGIEEVSGKVSNHPCNSTWEDIPEKRSKDDEVTVKEETKTSLELKCTMSKEENEKKVPMGSASTDQVPLEPEGNDKVKIIIETAENQSDANDLQQDEIEHNTAAENEADEKLSEHPFDSAIKDATEERQRTDEATQTHGRDTTLEVQYSTMSREENENKLTEGFIITDQQPIEHEDDTKSTQDTAESQIDDSHLQHDELIRRNYMVKQMKTATSFESTQREKETTIDSANITETESSDRMKTSHNQSEASTVVETVDECGLEDERGQSSQNTTKRHTEPSEKIITEDLESVTLVEKDEYETTIVNEETTEILSKKPADSTKEDATEEKLRSEATPTEETETNLDVQCCMNTEVNENQEGEDLIMTNQVPMEPVNENKVLSVQEAAENQSDANELSHSEVNTVISSESVRSKNEQATDSNIVHEIESYDKMETPCNYSEASPSTVVETLEECNVPEETGQSPENNTKRAHQLPQKNKEEVAMEPENEDIAKSTTELPEKQNDITDMEHYEVAKEPENEDNIKDLPEKQNDITNLQLDEMKIVTSSKSIQNKNENATDCDKVTVTQSLDKMVAPNNMSEASTVGNTLELECGLSDQRGESTTKGVYELPERIQEKLVEAEATEDKSLKQTQGEKEIICLETSSIQRTKQTEDNFNIVGNEEGDRTDLEDIQTIVSHLPITWKNEGSDGVFVEIPAEDADKQMKTVPTEALGLIAEALVQINEDPTIEKMVSDVLEEEAAFESSSHTNFQNVEEIRENEMKAKETTRANETEEQLQQLVPVEEKHKKSTEVTGEIAPELKPLPNETEEKLQQSFPKLVLHEQKNKGSLLIEEVAEESVQRVQSLEESNTKYSILEQIKDEKPLQEEVPRDPDFQIHIETSKSLHQKQDIIQEASTTDPEIIIQPRDFSSEIQCSVFSPENEEITVAHTSTHTSISESRDAAKAQAVYNEEDRDTSIPVQISIAASETADGKSEKVCKEVTDVDRQHNCSSVQIHEPRDDLNKSEETTNTNEKPMAENSGITAEELNSKEGFKQSKVIVSDARRDQIGKGHEVIAESNQEEEVAGEEEARPGDNAVLQSEEKSMMASVERDGSTRHKGEDNRQVVSAQGASASQESESHAIKESVQVGTAELSEMEGYSVKDAEDAGPAAKPRKSHNLLSGVGSKVKHSISKVKRAIAGKKASPKGE